MITDTLDTGAQVKLCSSLESPLNFCMYPHMIICAYDQVVVVLGNPPTGVLPCTTFHQSNVHMII